MSEIVESRLNKMSVDQLTEVCKGALRQSFKFNACKEDTEAIVERKNERLMWLLMLYEHADMVRLRKEGQEIVKDLREEIAKNEQR